MSLGLTGWWECLCNSPSLHGPDSGGRGRPHCTGNLTTGGGGEECGGGGGGHEPRCMSVRTTGSPPGKEVSSGFFSPSLPPPSLSPSLLPSFFLSLPLSLPPLTSSMCFFFPPFFTFACSSSLHPSSSLLPPPSSLPSVVVMLCGGNIDTTVLGRCLDRGLAADGRLVRFSVRVEDRPGGVASLTKLLHDYNAR